MDKKRRAEVDAAVKISQLLLSRDFPFKSAQLRL